MVHSLYILNGKSATAIYACPAADVRHLYTDFSSETRDLIATFTTVNAGFIYQYYKGCHATPNN